MGANKGAITDSYVGGEKSRIKGVYGVGGLAGYNVGSIAGSYSTSDVSGEGEVGGLVGNNGGPISTSYATGDVMGIGSGKVWRVGGLVGGWQGPDVNQPISASFATGDVSGYAEVGGLIGGMRQPIVNSYATGDVTGDQRVGGLVGGTSITSTTVTNSYAAGSVTGNSETGGMVGYNFVSGLQTAASYWDTQTSGLLTSAAGEGKTTSELQSRTSSTGIYATWDDEVWDFGTSRDYPTLKGLAIGVDGQRQSYPTAVASLGAPNIGTVTPGAGTLSVSWTAPSSDGGSAVTSYDLRYIEAAADETVESNWTLVEEVWATGGGTLRYTLTGLTGGTQYGLQVRAVNSGGDGPWSATDAATPGSTVTTPGASTVGAVTPGTGTLAVSWTAPSSDGGSAITDYDLRYIQTSADETVDSNWTVVDGVWTTGGGMLQHTLRELTGGTQYDLQVRAVNAEGDGPWSPTATGTPTSAADYDADDDGLIEIGNAAQLNAVRWDLDGDGSPASANESDYAAAFPNAAAGMGCPRAGCTGYELDADIDLDVAPYNTGQGWEPIGNYSAPFTATFEGNGNIIADLFIERSTADYVGLFGVVDSVGAIRNVGLIGVDVTGGDWVGGLAGVSGGRMSSSYAAGDVAGQDLVGGLVGDNNGVIIACYATGTVASQSVGGGLAGGNTYSSAVQFNSGIIVASYAAGTVAGDASGLVGQLGLGTLRWWIRH